MTVPSVLLNSLIANYQSEKSEALAMISLYLNNPQPVAEHSDILGELKKWTCKLSQADENLQVIEKYFTDNQEA
tara:strand:+ start:344 stop:565 length:222 start_codon:yes stop_codon:yes gene_type:complete